MCSSPGSWDVAALRPSRWTDVGNECACTNIYICIYFETRILWFSVYLFMFPIPCVQHISWTPEPWLSDTPLRWTPSPAGLSPDPVPRATTGGLCPRVCPASPGPLDLMTLYGLLNPCSQTISHLFYFLQFLLWYPTNITLASENKMHNFLSFFFFFNPLQLYKDYLGLGRTFLQTHHGPVECPLAGC